MTDDPYPFLAELLNSNDGSHRCLGTLVASDMVLTAAHCLYDTDVLVRLPAVTTSSSNGSATGATTRLFVVQAAYTHPSYYYNTYTGGIDVDPYDAALLQVYGSGAAAALSPNNNGTTSSRSPSDMTLVARLDRNLTVLPLNEGSGEDQSATPPIEQELWGLGWDETGEGDVERTRLRYIPNDACLLVNGTTNEGLEVSYASQVIDVTLCAAYEGGPGLCPGDSGGPIFLFDNSTATSVQAQTGQVGITSSSYGCLDKNLPTLNVRVHKVVDWVDAVVCNSSLYPVPEEFGCSPTDRHDPWNRTLADLTLQLDLGAHPMNLGWVLYQVVDENGHRRLIPTAERPIQFYGTAAAYATASEYLEVPSESSYELLLLDVSEGPSSSRLLQVSSSVHSVDDWVVNNSTGLHAIQFRLGTHQTAFPYTMNPTIQPTKSENAMYLTVVIVLDDYPTETGFLVEDLDGEVDDSESLPLLYTCYPGTFGPDKAREEVQLTVALPPYVERVRFTMTDNESDGLDPPGYYELWLGPRGNGIMLANGGVFYLEVRHEFSLPTRPGFGSSQVPSSLQPSTIQLTRPAPSPLPASAGEDASVSIGCPTIDWIQLPFLAIAAYLLMFTSWF